MAVTQVYEHADASDAHRPGVEPAAVDDDALDELLDNVLDNLVSDNSLGPPAKLGEGLSAEVQGFTATEATFGPSRGCEALPNPAGVAARDDCEAVLEEEFAKQLAVGMEELVQSMGGAERAGDFQKTMEQMIKQLAKDGNKAPSSLPSAAVAAAATDSESASTPVGTGTFQDKVNDTLNKLRSSSSQVGAELAEDSANDVLEDMMRQMGDMADLGDMDNLLEGMMEQLTSKEILYDPLVDLAKKYPQWLKKNKDKVPAEEYSRYQRQLSVILEIIKEYERPGFVDCPTSEGDSKRIVDLMQAMQESGQPPKEILEELAPGLELGEDGQPKLGEGAGCSIM